MKMFRNLSPIQEAAFRQWARENYKPGSDIKGIWHPVVQDECRKMNETGLDVPGTLEENLAKVLGHSVS